MQMVERHQVRLMDSEVAMIREFAGTDDFLLACVRVLDWNEDLTPWVAPGLFGKSDFSGRGPLTLDYLLKDMVPMILQEHADALAGKVAPYADFSSLFPGDAAAPAFNADAAAPASNSDAAAPASPSSAPSFDAVSLFDANSQTSSDPHFDTGSSLGIRIFGIDKSSITREDRGSTAGGANPTDRSRSSGSAKPGATPPARDPANPGSASPASNGVRLFLGGYSLAALFSLWAAYQTDIFSGVAAASPSLWYPDFVEYMEENKILTDAVYLSIGTKEEKIRNRVMSRVGDAIRSANEILTRQGILNTLEWNPGKHFQDAEKRTAMGFAWLLKNRYLWTMLD